jgi:UDP-glucose 4-epimerase
MTSSGGAVYGECRNGPATEQDVVKPASPYGLSKMAAETYMAWYAQNTDMQAIVLRLANVYGPGQGDFGEAGVISVFCKRLLAGRGITIFGDGYQTRDFVFVECVVDALRRASLYAKNDSPINICSGNPTALNDLALMVAQAAGIDIQVNYEIARNGEVRHSVLDGRRAERVLDWTAKVPLKKGLLKVLQDLRASQGLPKFNGLNRFSGAKIMCG